MQSNVGSTVIRVDTKLEGVAPSVSVCISISLEAVRLYDTHLGTRVLLDGWLRAGRAGGPGLPAKTLWIALPDRMTVKGQIVASAIKKAPITRGATTVAPLRAPRRDVSDRSRSLVLSVTKLPDLYRAEQQAVRPLARLLSTERVNQTTIALIEVSPVFTGPEGNLVLATELQVSVPLGGIGDVKALEVLAGELVPTSPAQLDRLYRIAQSVVVNPTDVVLPRNRSLRDLTVRWDYVILTDDTSWNAAAKTPGTAISPSIVNAFQALANWKTSLGLKARVVKVTDIVQSRANVGFGQDFISGASDLQEAIRRFLRWAHNTWGTAYVLLGGDEQIVPIRRLAIGSSWNKQMPTDLYYAALNPLNDDWSEGRAIDYGSYGFDRLMPNVSVGRAPASNANEAANFVTKVTNYERLGTSVCGLVEPWLERVLYVSTKWGGDEPTEVSQSASFPPGDNQYALDPSRTRSVIKLIDTVHVTQDPNSSTTSPSENCFNRAPGKVYVKIHLKATYKNPQDIVVNATSGKITLSHNDKSCSTTPGWFYTDWLDNDGPCHDASGQNYATNWIIVYMPSGLVPQSFDVRLNPALRLDYNLLSKLGPGNYRFIPYNIQAAATGNGWYFALSATDSTPSPVAPIGHQTPTAWITVYANAQERSPMMFVLDPTEEADTMGEQESLRKQVRRDIPGWDTQAALYPDVADVPQADQQGIDMQYYTKDRLQAKLNQGQHITSIGGHGNPWCTCAYGEGGAFDLTLADQLSNRSACGILYVNSCLTNRYTEDSLSRHLVMKNANGGAVGYVGFIDEVSIGLGHSVEKKFFTDLASSGILGVAVDARASMVVPGSGFDVNSADLRYTAFMMALLGDPALRVHGASREGLGVGALAAALDTAGQINIVYVRPDHKIAQIRQTFGGWTRAAVLDSNSSGLMGQPRLLAAVPNADGRVEAIYIGSDFKLHHIWQVAPNRNWSPSGILDNGSYAKHLVTVPNADKRLEVVYIGSDYKLYHIWQTNPNNGWSGSFVLDNGSYAKQLDAGRNKDGRIEVVYIGSDNKLYHIWQIAPNSGWSGSFVLDNGSYAKQLAIGSNADKRLEVVYVGSDNKLYHIWQTSPNGSWTSSYALDNGSYAKELALASNKDGRLEVFYTGSDDKLYHIWQTAPNGSWTQSYVLGSGSLGSELTVVPNADGRLEVCYIGLDVRLHHIWQTTPNGGWSDSCLLEG